ncbi:MAG: hypothetical protein DRP87_06580 [Spirochaetes bacterium]|nr:MAG: hypothetical protein DRP87_06580 [Spirochaetota bacterium]
MDKSLEATNRTTTEKIEEILRSLQEYIIEGGIKSGTEMPTEKELAKRLGVSRFILREALRVAQFQGLIEISRGSRTKVAEVSVKPAVDVMSILLRRSANVLIDLSEARESMECSIVELAALRADSGIIHQMQKTIREFEAHQNDIEVCIEKDIDFHNLIVKASKNAVFEIIMSPIIELLRQSKGETLRTFGPETAMKEHRAILEAIMERNPDKAKSCMKEHIRTAKKQLIAISFPDKNVL